MTRSTVTVGSREFTVSPDETGTVADRFARLLRARLVDELTGEPITGRPAIQPVAAPEGTRPHTGPGGLVGLVGVPRRALRFLATDPYDLSIHVSVPGWLPLEVGGTLPPQPAFPASFAPLDLGDVHLHRRAATLRGRTVRRVANMIQPAGAARVRLTAIWRQLPPATGAPPGAAPNIVSIDPPLYAERRTPLAGARTIVLTPVPGEDKRLELDAPAGASSLRLSDRVNLAAGNIVALGDERMRLAAVDGAVEPSAPATARLDHPLARSHRLGTVVTRVMPSAPGAPVQLSDHAAVGDDCLLVQSLASLGATATVEVDDGASPPEYHRLLPFDVQTDPDGQWRLPALSRVAQLRLEASKAPSPAVSRIVVPDYDRGGDVVDVVLP